MKKTHILVAEDDEHIRNGLTDALESEGYSVTAVANGRRALEAFQRQPCDLVLLDIMMPGKSGMELLSEIIYGYPDTGVIMLTGVTDTDTAAKAMREGALDYMTKPFDLDELTARIERALARRALLLENREYQQSLERMVTERTEQRDSDVTALNRLFQEHLHQQIQKSLEAANGYR